MIFKSRFFDVFFSLVQFSLSAPMTQQPTWSVCVCLSKCQILRCISTTRWSWGTALGRWDWVIFRRLLLTLVGWELHRRCRFQKPARRLGESPNEGWRFEKEFSQCKKKELVSVVWRTILNRMAFLFVRRNGLVGPTPAWSFPSFSSFSASSCPISSAGSSTFLKAINATGCHERDMASFAFPLASQSPASHQLSQFSICKECFDDLCCWAVFPFFFK